MRTVLSLAIVVTLGGFVPPRASSTSYTIVCSHFEESRATMFEMNDAGEAIAPVHDFTVRYDSLYVTPSPNGHLVVISGGWPTNTPSYFFLDQNREIVATAGSGEPQIYPAAFDKDGFLLYLLQYGFRSRWVHYGSCQLTDPGAEPPHVEGGYPEFRYSSYFGGLILPHAIEHYVVGVMTSPAGEFGAVTPRFYFTGGSNSDMDLSPDGRFVAIIGIDYPKLTILSVDPFGSFHLVQSLYNEPTNPRAALRIRYMPDGRHLIMLFSEGDFLVSLAVNPLTGEAIEVDHASLDPDALGGYPYGALAITPDGRYVVTLSGRLTGVAQTFLVFRLEEDGTLTRITQTRQDWPGYLSDMDFIPPYQEPVLSATGWMLHQ